MNKACFEKEHEIMFAGVPTQQNFFEKLCNRLQEPILINDRKENKMIAANSKNKSFVGAPDHSDDLCVGNVECADTVEQSHPLKKFLRALWVNVRLFFEADKWEPTVTLKVGDTHRMLRMDDIESRWRNPKR